MVPTTNPDLAIRSTGGSILADPLTLAALAVAGTIAISIAFRIANALAFRFFIEFWVGDSVRDAVNLLNSSVKTMDSVGRATTRLF